MSNPTAQPKKSDQPDVSVTVRSEAAAVGEDSPLEQVTAALPPKEAVSSLDAAKEYAASTLSSAATLPSTSTLLESLQQAKESTLLETAKSTPLSLTGQRAVQHAEALIDASQRLLEEKAPHDEAQTLLAEGAAAAAAVRDALAQHADVVGVFGSEQEREQAQHQVEDTLRRAFEVTQALVKQQDVRGMLADAANLAAQWVSAVSLASVHHAVAGVSDKGEQVLKDAAPALTAVHSDVDTSQSAKALVDKGRAKKAADSEMKEAADAREKLALKLAQLAEQARALAMQLKDHPQLRSVVSDLLHLFRAVTQRTWTNLATMASPTAAPGDATKPAVEPTVAIALDAPEVREHAEAASEAARKLIANFGGDLAPVQQALHQFASAARNEQPQITDLLDAMDEWLRDADSVADEAKAKRAYSLGQQLLAEMQAKAEDVSSAVTEEMQQQSKANKGELRAAIGSLLNESRVFVESLKHDETAAAVQTHLQELTNALFVDEQTGLAAVKPELLDDLRRLIPALVQALATLPVARIDVSSDEADVILDNISLAAEVLPKDLRIDTSTQVMLDTAKAVTTIKLYLRNMQVHIPDLVFWYNKKSFPQLVDVGIADVTIPRLDIDLVTQPTLEPNKLLRVLSCEAKVHDLVLDIKKARHNWMYTLLSPWVRRQLSSRIETAIQESVKSGIETIDRAAERAAETAQYAPQTLASLREALPSLPAMSAATQPEQQQQQPGLLESVSKRLSGVVEALSPSSTSVEKEQ